MKRDTTTHSVHITRLYIKYPLLSMLAFSMLLSTACAVASADSQTSTPTTTTISVEENKEAMRLSSQPIAEDNRWMELVQNSKGEYVYPKSVSVEGNIAEVRNPAGILKAHPQAVVSEPETTTITTTGDGSAQIVVDLGKVACGFVELGVVSASGAPIRMSYAEYLPNLGKWGDGDTRPDTWFYAYGNTGGPDDDPDGRADVFPPPIITPPKKYTVLISPGIRGSQRYIAITLDGKGTATLDFIRIRQTNYSGKYDGHFLSSDAILNAAWYGSAYAIDLSTARDTRFNPNSNWIILDGPKRDRLAYNNDLRIVGQSAFYQGIEYHTIIRNCLNLFAVQQLPDGTFPFASRADVPYEPYTDPGSADGMVEGYEDLWTSYLRIDSFTAWWIIQLDDYLRYSGDVKFVELMLPVARRAIEFFKAHTEPDSALWLTDNYDQKQATTWHTPYEWRGIDVYGNEAYYAALLSLARLEREVANDEAKAQELEELAGKVKQELVAGFWDEEADAMLLNSDSPKPDHTADANVGALLFNLLDTEKAKRVIEHLSTRLGTPYGTVNSEFPDNPYASQYISPYIMANEAIVRFNYNDGKGALDLIRRAWGNMLALGTGTPWEEIGLEGKPETARKEDIVIDYIGFLDLAHAWSTAIPALSMNIVGVKPMKDGYVEYSVEPKPVDLIWAQGAVPTPSGSINVRWIRGKDDRSFVMTVEAPEQYTGNISVPLLGGRHDIAMDGKMAWSKGMAADGFEAVQRGDTVVFKGVNGNHTLAWSE
jgi:alpha-L-rhamnosidase